MGSPDGHYPQPWRHRVTLVPATPSGWMRGSSSPCPASGTAGNSWEKQAQANHHYALCNSQRLGSTSLPAAAPHSPVLGTTCPPRLPRSLSFARQPAVPCPVPWPGGYSRPDGVGEEDGSTQEGREAQQGDEDSAHVRHSPGLAGGLAVLHQAGQQTGSRVPGAAVAWAAAPNPPSAGS